MKLSLIIPTYKRPTDLQRLFPSIKDQSESFFEILVIIGHGDEQSFQIARQWAAEIDNLSVIESAKHSVVFALNLGLSLVRGDIICLIDDDVFLPTNWAAQIRGTFSENSRIGAYGGRDRLQLNMPALDNPPLARSVGVYKWNGILVGNHHCGSQNSPCEIDVLKGANLSFRREAFKRMVIEHGLEGTGAEICWEIDICQAISQAGYLIVYDNTNFVLHYASQRLSFDDRSDIFSPATKKRCFNEALITAKFRPPFQIAAFFVRSFVLGSRNQPGIIWALLLLRSSNWKIMLLPFQNIKCYALGLKYGLSRRS